VTRTLVLRVLVPSAIALAAAAGLAVAAHLGSTPRAASRPGCPPPAAGSHTLAAGAGRTIAALTVRPQDGRRAAVAVRILDGGGPGRIALRVGAERIPLAATTTPGCYTATAPLARLAGPRVVGTLGGRPVDVAMPLPSRLRSGAALVAKARRATLALRDVRETTLARPSLLVKPTRVRSRYRGSGVTTISGGRRDTLRWPRWWTGFDWVTPGLQQTTILGRVRDGGRSLVLVSGVLRGAPVWMTLAIDPASGRVARAGMLADGHVMTSSYTSR
jgi:hypothetical protein